MEKKRCFWAENVPEIYVRYHDGEERYMMTISCLKCCFWNRFRLVCHGLPF